jgi:hypothetical protein
MVHTPGGIRPSPSPSRHGGVTIRRRGAAGRRSDSLGGVGNEEIERRWDMATNPKKLLAVAFAALLALTVPACADEAEEEPLNEEVEEEE